MCAQQEWTDATIGLPFLQALPKISFKTGGTLIALLGVFGEEFHSNKRQRLGHCSAINRRYRQTRNLAVDPLQGVSDRKWQCACKHLVQGDAQRVEIASSINRAIHTAGLFGCQVGERACNHLRWRRCLTLGRQSRGNPEACKPYVVGVVDEHIRRLDVLMYEAPPVDLTECRR